MMATHSDKVKKTPQNERRIEFEEERFPNQTSHRSWPKSQKKTVKTTAFNQSDE